MLPDIIAGGFNMKLERGTSPLSVTPGNWNGPAWVNVDVEEDDDFMMIMMILFLNTGTTQVNVDGERDDDRKNPGNFIFATKQQNSRWTSW